MAMEVLQRNTQGQKTDPPKLHQVVFLNDDYTSFDFVAKMLTGHFNKSAEEAWAITQEIHNKGRGIAGVFSKDVAESKRSKVMDEARKADFPLQVQCEPQ